jgi:hypothetical protein
MKETPAKVYYHVKKMEAAGIVALVHTKEINGIVAKYYEPAARDFDISSRDVPETVKKVIFSETHSIISNLFNNSRDIVLSQIEGSEDNGKSRMGCHFAMDELYLTDEEADDVLNYITELCNKKNNVNTKREETKIHHLFFVLCGRKE